MTGEELSWTMPGKYRSTPHADYGPVTGAHGQRPLKGDRLKIAASVSALMAVGVIAFGSLVAPALAAASAVPSRHVVVLEPCPRVVPVCWMTMREHVQIRWRMLAGTSGCPVPRRTLSADIDG
ncbi:MAG: hypothetical protein ACLP52_18970 [Streptosporangiaceae bacterium]